MGNGKIALKVRTLRFKGPSLSLSLSLSLRLRNGKATEKLSRWLPPGKLLSEMFLRSECGSRGNLFCSCLLFFVLLSLSSLPEYKEEDAEASNCLSWICSLAIPLETRRVRVSVMPNCSCAANNVLYQSVIPAGPEISTTRRRGCFEHAPLRTAT